MTPEEQQEFLERIVAEIKAGLGQRLLTAQEVRQYVPFGRQWLTQNIPSVKVGSRRYWRHSAVQEFIARHKSEIPGSDAVDAKPDL